MNLQAVELARMMDWAPLEQYAPTLSSTGTQPTGQTVTGRFRRAGALAFVSGAATLSSVGTGEYRVSLPTGWTAATVAGMYWEGSGRSVDVSVGGGYRVVPVVGSGGTVIGLNWSNGSSNYLSFTSTSPYAMASGDTLSWSLWLELDGA